MPGLHGEQADAPVADPYMPAGHGVQELEPRVEYIPPLQLAHADWPRSAV